MIKAVIPVAGVGSKLRPHTHTQPKSLIPVAGKPILAHIIDGLKEGGINEFIFVIGYMGEKIEDYIRHNYPDIESKFVVQTSGKGTAQAIWLAASEINNDDEILIVFGDTIIKWNFDAIFKSEFNMLGLKKVEDPRNFGVAELDESGFIKKMVEKPLIPKSNLALVGVYKIKDVAELKSALDYNLNHDIGVNEEYHLTDALMRMIDQGSRFKSFDVESWFDCGKKDILLETNSILLKGDGYQKPKESDYERTIIIPPVYIGKSCKISNSIIGPNVSIGDHVHLNYTIIKNSIIGPNSQIETANLENSLIGNDASLEGVSYCLNLGESTEIKFG